MQSSCIRWEDNIKMYFKEIRCDGDDCIRRLRVEPSQYSDKTPGSTEAEEGTETCKNVSFQIKIL